MLHVVRTFFKGDEIIWQFPINLGVKKGIGFHKHAHPTLLWKGTNADELLQVGVWISTSVSVVGAAATSMLPNK